YRTVVIDADLRRPTVHRVFNVAAEPGLCEAITQPIDPSTVIQPTSQDGLFVISSGQLTGEALRQLAQDGMTPLMERLRAEFDFVVVDTSPLIPVTDGLLIAQYVDGVILSVRRDVSQYSKVASACQKLQMMGAPVWGAVVIGVDQSPSGYRYSYGYGYGAKVNRTSDEPSPDLDPAEGGGA
ncbi:MAG: CpsD/CapB family tyrosine-protein kinase, partial [Planctomycetota bacterium]|nr:CpsD/CapB family tyrosine-protein kinase [Planctomycetota bacterium]